MAPAWESFPEVNRVLAGSLLALLVERMVRDRLAGAAQAVIIRLVLDPAGRLGLQIPFSAPRPHAGAPAPPWNPPRHPR